MPHGTCTPDMSAVTVQPGGCGVRTKRVLLRQWRPRVPLLPPLLMPGSHPNHRPRPAGLAVVVPPAKAAPASPSASITPPADLPPAPSTPFADRMSVEGDDTSDEWGSDSSSDDEGAGAWAHGPRDALASFHDHPRCGGARVCPRNACGTRPPAMDVRNRTNPRLLAAADALIVNAGGAPALRPHEVAPEWCTRAVYPCDTVRTYAERYLTTLSAAEGTPRAHLGLDAVRDRADARVEGGHPLFDLHNVLNTMNGRYLAQRPHMVAGLYRLCTAGMFAPDTFPLAVELLDTCMARHRVAPHAAPRTIELLARTACVVAAKFNDTDVPGHVNFFKGTAVGRHEFRTLELLVLSTVGWAPSRYTLSMIAVRALAYECTRRSVDGRNLADLVASAHALADHIVFDQVSTSKHTKFALAAAVVLMLVDDDTDDLPARLAAAVGVPSAAHVVEAAASVLEHLEARGFAPEVVRWYTDIGLPHAACADALLARARGTDY